MTWRCCGTSEVLTGTRVSCQSDSLLIGHIPGPSNTGGHPRIARNGMAHRVVYVTSASIGVNVITERLSNLLEGQRPLVAVSPLSEMLGLGYPGGWHREDCSSA